MAKATLRGKKPKETPKRLKLLLFSPAGVGKTMAAIQMPAPYIIDCERGTDHYGDMIEKSGGAVFPTNDMLEVIDEVKALLAGGHPYKTLVIDPFTPLYEGELERGEAKVGTEWGRHYGEANKPSKRLFNLLTKLDMNVIVTAHAKWEYEGEGDNRKRVGLTFDGWKKLDYLFDLVLELQRHGKAKDAPRKAVVRKTRLAAFPDQEMFPWSFAELANRYGAEDLGREAEAVSVASEEQIARLNKAIKALNLDAETVDKWLKKAGVEDLADMTEDEAAACIKWCEAKAQEVSA